MDSRMTESRSLRRSTRRPPAVCVEAPAPRGPLKRTKRTSGSQAPLPAVNGSKDVENGSEDEGSPSKKSRLDTEGGEEGGGGDEVEMDVQESAEDLKKSKDQDMNVRQEIFLQPKSYHGALGDVNLLPRVALGERCRSGHALIENADLTKTKIVKPSSKGPEAPAKSAVRIKLPAQRHNVSIPKISSMVEYQRTMEAKARSSGLPSVNHHLSGCPASQEPLIKRRHVNNLPNQKDAARHKKQEGKKKTAVIKESESSRGFMWYFWCLVLLVLLSSAVFLAYKSHMVHRNTACEGESPARVVKPEMFADQLSLLETQFPSQQAEVWKRIKIHLEKHLQSAQPTEPVSLILTAGLRAERSLHCLAQGLASSYSSALNTSVLHIDGVSKASQDSDEVKLDIDKELLAAFEGDKPVAVIHRFEELPPGSTLIFYRYCDHENAAYKRVFLLFTVLLPQDEVGADVSLRDLEEMVHDFVKKRLVGSSSPTDFNEMDNDKFSGLWSRISHLVLPVVSEKVVEQKGC
ncbi:torsin-1A-interacting protein 2 [Labrus bergylta]|uniref:torsin-1A-interacting protein 2 n=1 Tax=Labrus bergylta TaxID=56723 RepID=UPI003314125D